MCSTVGGVCGCGVEIGIAKRDSAAAITTVADAFAAYDRRLSLREGKGTSSLKGAVSAAVWRDCGGVPCRVSPCSSTSIITRGGESFRSIGAGGMSWLRGSLSVASSEADVEGKASS